VKTARRLIATKVATTAEAKSAQQSRRERKVYFYQIRSNLCKKTAEREENLLFANRGN
jgi:hypothetical protein